MKFFSIIIPVKGRYKKNKFPSFCEVIYINKYTKSEARNFGSRIAEGKFLVHIDKDNEISDSVLLKAKSILEKNKVKAIVLEEYIKKQENTWQKARGLERKILVGNKILATPQIIEKRLFKEIGGYDERFNELDDWALALRLKKQKYKMQKIQMGTSIFEPTNIFQILRRRFKKGQELKYFKEIYGGIPQVDTKNILDSYIKTPPNISLLILKFFDYLGLFLGNLFPNRPNIDEHYKNKLVAKNFDNEQLRFYGKLKDYFEKKGLSVLIEGNKILDLGAGTGRLTKFLLDKDYKVTACDISKEMLSHFPKNLPKSILLTKDRLPFKNNSFDTVFSMRVIWHIKNDIKREKFFKEAVRVSKKIVLIDFSFFGSSSDHQFGWHEIQKLTKKYKLKITNYIYLPLGRLLIKFEKK